MAKIVYQNLRAEGARLISVSSGTATNLTEVSQTMSIGFQESLATTLSFSLTSGIKAGASTRVEVGLPFIAKGEAKSSRITGNYTGVFSKVWAHAGAIDTDVTGFVSGITAYDVSVSYTEFPT